MYEENLKAYIHYFENLTLETLEDVVNVMANNARFKDPFNDVKGIAHVIKIFQHMFETLDDPKFIIDDFALSEQGMGLILWTMTFRLKGKSVHHEVQGTSTVVFNEDGKVIEHIDYWDTSEQLYEPCIPILGRLLKMIRRRLSAT